MAKNLEYKVLVGLDYPPAKRAEVGDVVSDLPKDSITWLLSGGYIMLNSDAPVEAAEPEAPIELEEQADA